jgi:DnaJ-class molecular chaperone
MTIDQRIERAVSVMREACHACDGEGSDYDRDWDGERYIWFRRECSACNGSGEYIEEEDDDGDL